jgi:hypothetical protein
VSQLYLFPVLIFSLTNSELRSWSRFREEREERLRKERHLMERVRLKNMASAKEYEEILKR